MAILYKVSKHAITDFGESLTEQEHKDSCDINLMVGSALRGLQVRGSLDQGTFGYDDLTMDAVQHRIQKETLERELKTLAEENEFSEDELNLIPDTVKTKFKFKTRKKVNNNDAPKNDDKTTKNDAPKVDDKSPGQTT